MEGREGRPTELENDDGELLIPSEPVVPVAGETGTPAELDMDGGSKELEA